jgi:hypothetical protein
MGKRTMAGLSGSVIELSNYLEQRISQKSAEYAAVRKSWGLWGCMYNFY